MFNNFRQPAAAAAESTHADNAEMLLEKVLNATAAQPRRFSVPEIKDMATTVSKSGLYKMSEAQITTLMLLCDAEGMHPIEAVRIYHIFDGQITMRADAMLARFQKDGGKVEWVTVDSAVKCDAWFYHDKYCPKGKLVSFTMEDATKASLANKPNWKNHPRSMMRARVITNAIRMIHPGIVAGIYTPDEIAEARTRRRRPEQVAQDEPQPQPQPVPQPTPEPQPEPQPVPQPEPEVRTQRPPREASTEWGLWIQDALVTFNADLARMAEVNPDKLELRTPVRPQQVVNGVLNLAVKDEWIAKEACLDERGRRNSHKMAAVMTELWDSEPDVVPDLVGRYLRDKMMSLLNPPAPAAPAAPAAAPVATEPAAA